MLRRLLLALVLVALSGTAVPAGPNFLVFRPLEQGQPAPAVLVIPGGGWKRADPYAGAYLARQLAERGFVGVAVGHRPGPFPAPLEDVRHALYSVRADAGKHGVDPRRIGLLGKSSGGHLASLAGLTGRVQAVAVMCAPLDLLDPAPPTAQQRDVLLRTFGTDRETLRRYSPMEFVKVGAPPFLLIHGERDELVPARQSERFHARLQKAGVPSQLVLVPGVGHDFGSRDGKSPAQEAEIFRFLERRLKPAKPGS